MKRFVWCNRVKSARMVLCTQNGKTFINFKTKLARINNYNLGLSNFFLDFEEGFN